MGTLLLVENDLTLLLCLQFSLHREGWEVTGVASVEDACRNLAQRDFDLIVTDYQLSTGGDGLSLLAHVRKDTSAPPVILMTASRMNGLEKQAREQGAVAFLRKPFDMDRFLRACRNALVRDTEKRKEKQ